MKLAQCCSSLEGYQGPIYSDFAKTNVPQVLEKKFSEPETAQPPEKEEVIHASTQGQVTAAY